MNNVKNHGEMEWLPGAGEQEDIACHRQGLVTGQQLPLQTSNRVLPAHLRRVRLTHFQVYHPALKRQRFAEFCTFPARDHLEVAGKLT
jgi:hypothetical protein